MNDTSIYALSPAQLLEIETLRDQRDLYRSLLLSEIDTLGTGLTQALGSVEQLRSLLRAQTRDGASFRGKIEHLLAELELAQPRRCAPLHLPTIGQPARRAPRRRCMKSKRAPRSRAMTCCRPWWYSGIFAATSPLPPTARRCTYR